MPLTNPGSAGAPIPAIKELQGLRIDLVGAALANVPVPIDGMTENSVVVCALNNDAGTITDVTDTISISDNKATGTLTLDTVVADETATVHDVVFTFKASPSAVYNSVQLGATDTASAANLAAAINAYFSVPGSTYAKVTATSDAAVVTVKAFTPGEAGNAIALAGDTTITASAATLEDGDVASGVASSGATDQLIVFWFNK